MTTPEEIFNKARELNIGDLKLIDELYKIFKLKNYNYQWINSNHFYHPENKLKYIKLFLKEFPKSIYNLIRNLNCIYNDESDEYNNFIKEVANLYIEYLINNKTNIEKIKILITNYLILKKIKEGTYIKNFMIELKQKFIEKIKYFMLIEEIDKDIKDQLKEIPEFNCSECNCFKLN